MALSRTIPLIVLLVLVPFHTQAREVLFVDAAFCPLVCNRQQTGKDGFVVDIIRDALEQSGHQLVFRTEPFQRALTLVRTGQADGLPAIYPNDAPDLLFGESVIAKGENAFFVRTDSPWRYNGTQNWTELRIAIIDGYTFNHPEFDQYVADVSKSRTGQVIRISGSNPYQRMLQMLISGRIDAILDDSVFIFYALSDLLKTHATNGELPIKNAGLLSEGQNVVAYSPVNPESSAELIRIIDPFIRKVYQSGKINDYIKPYGLEITEDHFQLIQ